MKKWQKAVLAGVIVLALAGAAFFIYLRTYRLNSINQPKSYQTPETTPVEPANPAPAVYFPISGYSSRLTFRWFGKFVNNEPVSPCGANFSGYHTADDLEILSGESSASVPVYAVSESTVRQIGNVGGYGGLIVLETSVNGEKYTLYYGHIDITNSTLKKDDTIKAGEKLANLSPACSTASGGERKHLHFGIRKGTTIDIRGYVPNKIELSNWINPKVFLMQQNAKEIQ